MAALTRFLPCFKGVPREQVKVPASRRQVSTLAMGASGFNTRVSKNSRPTGKVEGNGPFAFKVLYAGS
eukprot:1176997-Prorocentrum_minimum.AAC.5